MYAKGRRAEHYVISKLQSLGADLVIRSSRSLGAADLVAIFLDKREIWFLQVKAGKREPKLETLQRSYPELSKLRGKFEVKSGFFFKRNGHWQAVFE
jgi:Holliday junction resolvase-like predicted endonuclease